MVASEKFKESRDEGNEFGALLADHSNTFDCIDHKPVMTNLTWYGVRTKYLNLTFSSIKI